MVRGRGTARGAEGFTFVEVLVALAVLSFGITAIFRGFFLSVAATRLIRDRQDATLALEAKRWQVQQLVDSKELVGGYTDTGITGEDPVIRCAVRLQPLPGFRYLYRFEGTAAWEEGSKTVTIRRLVLLQKTL